MKENTEITVWKIGDSGGDSGMVVKMKTTAGEFLKEIGPQFLLDQNDINYILEKTPDDRPERWTNLVASMALFIRCPRSRIPPMTVDLIIKKIANLGYHLSEKYVWNGMRRIRKLKLYPSFCPIDEVELLKTYHQFLAQELKMEDSVVNKAREILVLSKEKGIAIRHNSIIRIFSALYIAGILCGDYRTQEELAKIGGTNMVSIGSAYKEMAERMDIEIIL